MTTSLPESKRSTELEFSEMICQTLRLDRCFRSLLFSNHFRIEMIYVEELLSWILMFQSINRFLVQTAKSMTTTLKTFPFFTHRQYPEASVTLFCHLILDTFLGWSFSRKRGYLLRGKCHISFRDLSVTSFSCTIRRQTFPLRVTRS
jgi:hypothetical protein